MKVYMVCASKGSWDDWNWFIYGIYPDSIRADEAKQKLVALKEAGKKSETFFISNEAGSMNDAWVQEVELGKEIHQQEWITQLELGK